MIVLAVWAGLCSDRVYCAPSGPAESLYLQLSGVGLDPARVFRVRNGSIDRSAIHLTLEDGTIAFTQDVQGRITGAFFEGEGEILLVPPNDMERRSMSVFTGMAILEERFATAYFRFNDNTAAELQPSFRAPDDAQGFLTHWNDTARNLAPSDAMRLLVSFSGTLPATGENTQNVRAASPPPGDQMFHARLQGEKLGVFDVLYDSTAGEQVEAGQARAAEDGTVYYDVWTSFSPKEPGQPPSTPEQNSQTVPMGGETHDDPIVVHRYVIDANVKPPKELNAEAQLQLDVVRGGARMLVFELSRFLHIQTVEADGHAVEFLQNPAVEGTQLARRGNDLVAVVLPEPARAGQKIRLRFVYGGEVLAEAGNGLLYVGARGTWYPNRGMAMADFDLTFHYPAGWTLLATGKSASQAHVATPRTAGEQTTHWISERPIPLAGFNLGKYVRASVQAGNVSVETYATGGVEKDFPSAPPEVIQPIPASPEPQGRSETIPASPPSPARNAMTVAEVTSAAIQYYAQRFGPFPYSKLALTQIPGRESQGWPGLVFLSSYAFLSKEERQNLHMDAARSLIDRLIPAHETAHQWWGDLITWSTYRDQWVSEGLANYCSLMMLQERDPAGFREVMERYRQELITKNKDGSSPKDAGPVTLGTRLLSSRFPQGYEAISYGRGTWLFHMLRSMLRDADNLKDSNRNPADEPFVRALRRLRERYEGKAMSTADVLSVFAEDLPPSLRYEGKASLDWFLESWVNGTSVPKLELRGVKFSPKASAIIVTGTILQKEAPDNLVTSVPVYAVTSGRSPLLLGRVFADGEESSFHLSAPPGTHKLLLDPNDTILTTK